MFFRKIDYKNILKAVFAGILVGIVFFLTDSENEKIVIVQSGLLGLIIGTLTEVVTALLPITMANPKNYYLISSILSLVFSSVIITLFSTFWLDQSFIPAYILLRILVVFIIIIIIEMIAHFNYIRSNNKLKRYQEGEK